MWPLLFADAPADRQVGSIEDMDYSGGTHDADDARAAMTTRNRE